MKRILSAVPVAIGVILLYGSAHAQLPESDIFLFEIKRMGNTVIIKKGENITNRPGYDNQPFFTPDNKAMLYVSIREDKQADIYSLSLGSKKITQVTFTKESEYSPVILPGNKTFSAVVVEADSTQRIWTYDLANKQKPVLVMPEDSVGYYSWINKDSILYYKLTEPHSLHVFDIKNKKDTWITNDPLRSFKPIKNFSFFYGTKEKNQNIVRIYNMRLKRSEEYAYVKATNEDFIWDKTMGLIKSDGSKIMRYNDDVKTWVELADLSAFGINKITRFAFSGNGRWLAVVSNKG
jgi:Tol biopolymer transport system component